MNSIAEKYLNIWKKFTGYDKDSTSFSISMSSSSFDDISLNAHIVGEKLKEISGYDPNGLISMLYAKNSLIEYTKDKTLKLYPLLADRDAVYKWFELYDTFMCDEVIDIERNVHAMIGEFTYSMTGQSKKLENNNINDISKSLCDIIDRVVDGLTKLNVRVYQKSNSHIKINNISKSFNIFNSLSDCLLKLNTYDDGMYICFINQAILRDSYFGFFIKSNDNLFSIDERICEVYPGQHYNHRNGRYLEDKALELFPYNIFDYSEYDYKGYARCYRLKDNIESLSDIEFKYIELMSLAMFMIINKYNNSILDGDIIYLDALLPVNIQFLSDVESTYIVKADSKTLIKQHDNLNINFTKDEIINGCDGVVKSDKSNRCVKLYAEGFEPDFESILYHPNLKLLTGEKDYNQDNEFIGSEYMMRKVAYMNIRKQLKDYIENKIYEEYNSNGGWEYYKQLLTNMITDNIDYYRNELLVQVYINKDKYCDSPFSTGSYYKNDDNRDNIFRLISVKYDKGYIGTSILYNYKNNSLDGYNYPDKCIDPESNTQCNIFFKFTPRDGEDLELLFGSENIPNIMKVWNEDNTGEGNSILDVTDPCSAIEFSFYQIRGNWNNRNYDNNFSFTIGMSIRTLKNKFRDYKAKHKDKIEELDKGWDNREILKNKFFEDIKEDTSIHW